MWGRLNLIFLFLFSDRQQEFEVSARPPSPPAPTHYTDAEANVMAEKLKGDAGPHEFTRSCSTLVNWLDRGEVNKRSANNFYTLLQVSVFNVTENSMGPRNKFSQRFKSDLSKSIVIV